MKKEMKDQINHLDKRVSQKLIKRLNAESFANKHDLEIHFNKINYQDYVDAIIKAQIIKVKI